MKTDDLVTMLATGTGPVQPNQVLRRYSVAVGLGALGAAALMLVLIGPRPDLAAAFLLPMFWVKIVFVACLAAVSLLVALRLSRPGMRLSWLPGALAAPVVAMWVLAAFVLIRAEPALRAQLFFGDTWNSCPFLIATLSAPAFVAVFWAMRGLAPTRLRLSGAASGLLSGAVGTLMYSVHCPEMDAPFIGFWYLLGMLIPTVVGALLGPRLLRW
ncbi:MAG: hypothetical protein A3G25_13045 [Betaproteobacteria bacterium RIFCSPLOWO2_12_FULL_63_13]|nr:MAG: hypothetical protein A3H32_04705 [Betaproteobacteria bacterium RIFCSPLOWO2_02_FULL_63_19]OGA48727.1 MAG: hypothetical protein A3G25_13045 [Betaproteobacteria bacterium RIFCSPLOWO2_12_FULL_63_13]